MNNNIIPVQTQPTSACGNIVELAQKQITLQQSEVVPKLESSKLDDNLFYQPEAIELDDGVVFSKLEQTLSEYQMQNGGNVFCLAIILMMWLSVLRQTTLTSIDKIKMSESEMMRNVIQATRVGVSISRNLAQDVYDEHKRAAASQLSSALFSAVGQSIQASTEFTGSLGKYPAEADKLRQHQDILSNIQDPSIKLGKAQGNSVDTMKLLNLTPDEISGKTTPTDPYKIKALEIYNAAKAEARQELQDLSNKKDDVSHEASETATKLAQSTGGLYGLRELNQSTSKVIKDPLFTREQATPNQGNSSNFAGRIKKAFKSNNIELNTKHIDELAEHSYNPEFQNSPIKVSGNSYELSINGKKITATIEVDANNSQANNQTIKIQDIADCDTSATDEYFKDPAFVAQNFAIIEKFNKATNFDQHLGVVANSGANQTNTALSSVTSSSGSSVAVPTTNSSPVIVVAQPLTADFNLLKTAYEEFNDGKLFAASTTQSSQNEFNKHLVLQAKAEVEAEVLEETRKGLSDSLSKIDNPNAFMTGKGPLTRILDSKMRYWTQLEALSRMNLALMTIMSGVYQSQATIYQATAGLKESQQKIMLDTLMLNLNYVIQLEGKINQTSTETLSKVLDNLNSWYSIMQRAASGGRVA